MRIARLAVVALCANLVAVTQARTQGADVFGVWEHPKNGSHLEVYKCGESLCAKVVKITDPTEKDVKNPDPAKRAAPIVGLVIMSDGKPSGDKAWSGTLYNTEDGKSYTGKIVLKSADVMDMSGCVARVLCQTLSWKRISAAK